jgi:hypothetical protein
VVEINSLIFSFEFPVLARKPPCTWLTSDEKLDIIAYAMECPWRDTGD